MPVGPLLSPWAAGSSGQFLGIRHGVSRARNFTKWARYARLFGRAAGFTAGGYVGAAVGLGTLAYEGYQGYMQYRRRSVGRRTRNGSRRRRTPRSGAVRKRVAVGRKRSAVSARLVRRGGTKRRKFTRVRRTGTVTNTEYAGITKVPVKLGFARPLPKKQLRMNYRKLIARWQRVNTVTAASAQPGALWMDHTTVSTDQTACPCFIMCLNQVNNGAYVDGPFYQLRFNNTGQVVLTTITSQKPDGTLDVTGAWQPEKGDSGTGSIRHMCNAWWDIRLMCYGATAQPTTYDIMIISFADGYLDPLETPSNAQEAADRHAVWQCMVQPYMTNPIMPVLAPRRKYKIHKRIRFNLQSTLSIENDTDPASRGVRMFVRDGSVYDYCYHGDGFTGAGADDKLSTVQWVAQQQVAADYSDRPMARARKWLVIRAVNTTRSTTEDATNTPSIDVCVRQCVYARTS